MTAVTITCGAVQTPDGPAPDIPEGVQWASYRPDPTGETYTVEIKGPPEAVAAALLESESHPLSLAIKALLAPMVEQANAIAERTGHKDLARNPGQITDSARRSLEKGDDGGKVITPPKDGGVSRG